VINLQTFLQCHAHEQMWALDEFGGRSPVELFELAYEVGLIKVSCRRDVAPISQLLPSQAIGRMQRPELPVQALGRAAEIGFAQSLHLARRQVCCRQQVFQLVRLRIRYPARRLHQELFVHTHGRVVQCSE